MEEDYVSNVENVPVAEKLLRLKYSLMYDRANPVYTMLGPNAALGVQRKMMRTSLIRILPGASVPLYCTPSILMSPVSGVDLSMLVEVNTLSLGAFAVCNNIDITDQTKIHFAMNREMFTKYALDVTTFGILRMTRIMIPVLDMNLGEEFKRSYLLEK